MKENMEKLENAMNELMDICKSEIGRMMFDADEVDERGLLALRSCFKLVSASMSLMKEQTDMMVEMNKKLDKLIVSKE
jgi:hypothetical protein